MERTEPTFIPEWLKNSSNSAGVSSSSYSDDQSAPSVSKNNSSLISNGHNFRSHYGSERTSNSNARWSSGGISSGRFRSYSNSGRNQRDRPREMTRNGSRDQEKSFLEDSSYLEHSEPERNSSFSRFGRDGLRRSQSMMPGKHGDSWTRKSDGNLSGASGKKSDDSLSKISLSNGANKTTFERDFPSLRTDERTVVSDIGRVPSPGLTPPIQSLPISSSASSGEKWTSALAEVPILFWSNESSSSNIASSSSLGLSATNGFNMADAVTHGPIHATTAPQLSNEAQRREELAIKQSRQLIPVTPSIPKASALNSFDKQRNKVNYPSRFMPGLSDSSKSANPVKFHVLKSKERNCLSSVVAPDKPGKCITNGDRKPISTIPDKRPNFQAKSRNEFFKLMKKKSMESSSVTDQDSTILENTSIATLPSTETITFDTGTSNVTNEHLDNNEEMHAPVITDEEEAAFLRSLGWEENDENDDGISEEEISAFRMNLTKFIESKPSLRILQGTKLGFLLPFESSHKGNGISSDSKLEL